MYMYMYNNGPEGIISADGRLRPTAATPRVATRSGGPRACIVLPFCNATGASDLRRRQAVMLRVPATAGTRSRHRRRQTNAYGLVTRRWPTTVSVVYRRVMIIKRVNRLRTRACTFGFFCVNKH